MGQIEIYKELKLAHRPLIENPCFTGYMCVCSINWIGMVVIAFINGHFFVSTKSLKLLHILHISDFGIFIHFQTTDAKECRPQRMKRNCKMRVKKLQPKLISFYGFDIMYCCFI